MGPQDRRAGPRYRRGNGSLHRRCGAEFLVLLPGEGEPVLLAGAAAILWQSLDEPRTLGEAVDRAREANPGVDAVEAGRLLSEATTTLTAAGAIEAIDDQPPAPDR